MHAARSQLGAKLSSNDIGGLGGPLIRQLLCDFDSISPQVWPNILPQRAGRPGSVFFQKLAQLRSAANDMDVSDEQGKQGEDEQGEQDEDEQGEDEGKGPDLLATLRPAWANQDFDTPRAAIQTAIEGPGIELKRFESRPHGPIGR